MKPKFSVLAATLSLCLALVPTSSGVTVTWDADTATAAAQNGSGQWTPVTTNFWNGTANVTPVRGDTIFIGVVAPVGDPDTVTISNGGAMLNIAENISGTNTNTFSNLTFARSYNLAAAAPGDGISIGDMTVTNTSTVNITARIDGGQPSNPATPASPIGTRSWNVINGSTLNLSGGGRIQSMANGSITPTAINLTAGQWKPGGYAADGTETGSNNVNLGGGGSEARILTVTQSAAAVITSTSGNFNIGGNMGSNADTTTTYNLNGGSITGPGLGLSLGGGTAGTAGAAAKATLNVNNGAIITSGTLAGNTVTGGNEIRVGNDGSGGTLNLNNGEMSTGAKMIICRRGNTGGPIVGTTNIKGGVLRVAQVQFGDNQTNFVAGSSSTFNLTGGIVYFTNGTGFVVGGTNPNLTTSINLSGGTLAATNAWTTALPLNLTNTDGGVTFQAADAVAAAKNITLTGLVSGTGGFTKTGAGTLTVSGGYDYTGNTTVNAGILSLATGTLANSSTVTLATGAKLNLTHSDTDVVAGLSLGGTLMPASTYDSTNSSGFITGTGKIQVVIVTTPYDTWIADPTYGIPAGAKRAANADPDADGVSNVLEFILGGNPSISSTGILPHLTVTSANYVFTFTRRTDWAAVSTLAFQWGGTLDNWSHTVPIPTGASGPDANGVTTAVSSSAGNPDTVTVTLPRTNEVAGKLFGRLKASTL